MKKFTLILLSLYASVLIQGQQKDVFLTIDGKEISREEFLWMYNKNSSATGKKTASEESPEAYLERYIDFQLKIRDAEKMGLDTSFAFRKDMSEYKDQLVSSYLYQEPDLGMLVQEAYDRMKFDVNASHIQVRVSPSASPADSLKAYQKISALRERALRGEDFRELAREYSEDQLTGKNGGDLNYFTVFSMAYPIETAAYNTAPGEISLPVRSYLGYHIVKVNDKRKAAGKVRVASIFTSTAERDGSPKDQKSIEAAKKNIEEAYRSLMLGRPFPEVVDQYSEEPGASETGGEYPPFGVGKMAPEFEKAAFALGGPGSISRPFETVFGWHVVMLLEKIPVGSFRGEQEWIKSKVLSDRRPEYHHMLHVEWVKNHYGFEAYPERLETVFSEGDSSLLKGEWDAGILAGNQTTLMSIGESKLSIGDFARFIEKTQSVERRARDPRYYMSEMYYQFLEKSVLDYEYDRAVIEHPEINLLLEEYRDGMLLFEVSNREVWSKALSDTAGLNAYFMEHRDLYMWKERTDAFIVTCTPGASVEKVRKKYKKIQSEKYSAEILNDKYCDNDTVACVHLARVLTEEGVYKRIDQAKGIIGPGPVYDSEVTKGFVIINEVRPPEPKKLEDVKGQVVSDYQKYLEEAWLEDLKKRYRVTIHEQLTE